MPENKDYDIESERLSVTSGEIHHHNEATVMYLDKLFNQTKK